jgi:hypothetical protein
MKPFEKPSSDYGKSIEQSIEIQKAYDALKPHEWPIKQQFYEELQFFNAEQVQALLTYLGKVLERKIDPPLPK